LLPARTERRKDHGAILSSAEFKALLIVMASYGEQEEVES
jgi:hypothetical protein